eukprot:93307-Chlamydomonas_euryale.AAC.5
MSPSIAESQPFTWCLRQFAAGPPRLRTASSCDFGKESNIRLGCEQLGHQCSGQGVESHRLCYQQQCVCNQTIFKKTFNTCVNAPPSCCAHHRVPLVGMLPVTLSTPATRLPTQLGRAPNLVLASGLRTVVITQ